MYFDTHYNKCAILFTDVNLSMNCVLTCQLIGIGVGKKLYVSIRNRNPTLYKHAK